VANTLAELIIGGSLASRAVAREPYNEYDAFADDEGVDDRLRADVADALGEKYVEELDI
jgi:hypothetical protein